MVAGEDDDSVIYSGGDTHDSHRETNRRGFTFHYVKLKVAPLSGCVCHSQRH